MLLYKVGRFFYKKKVPFSAFVFNGLIRLIHNSAVFVETEIGKNTIFGYGGVALVIHKRAVIGSRCTIGSCVTIGGRSNSHGVPVIGDDVYIATGAKILGDITIGEGSVIGANAVVITSIPPKSLVVGVPARVIRSDIDFKQYI